MCVNFQYEHSIFQEHIWLVVDKFSLSNVKQTKEKKSTKLLKNYDSLKFKTTNVKFIFNRFKKIVLLFSKHNSKSTWQNEL